jgi:hypothetical protein
MTVGRKLYVVLVALAFVVAALFYVRTPPTMAQMMQTNGSSGGGCSDSDLDLICNVDDNCPSNYNPNQADADTDTIGDVCDPCPNLWHVAPSCPDPAGLDLQLEAGPGRPGLGDPEAHLKVWNNSYYEYKVDLDQTSSHAYCPTCVADDLTSSPPHPSCANWSNDYAACGQTSAPNPKSYGGSTGNSGSISPCAGTAAAETLEIGENRLEYHPYHHCCDISADIVYAARLVIKQYRHINDSTWRNFPTPLPEKAGWVTRHTVDVGFPDASPSPYPLNYEGFSVDDVTTSGCAYAGDNVHYATSSLDTDGDGIPNACDCDDDNDCCLDGNDLTSHGTVDQSLNKCQRPAGCNSGTPVSNACSSYQRGFGTYADYPNNCRGYDPATHCPWTIPDPCTP